MSQPLFPESPRTNCFPVVFSARAFFLLAWCGLMVLPATAAVRYVNLNNPTPTPPYTNWATAARTIQDAVDVTVDGDEVLVTNGVYRTGGRAAPPPVTTPAMTLTNRVTITNQITLRSVNGPEVTIIEGAKAQLNLNGQARCVSLSNNAVLTGFTLTNGSAAYVYFIMTNGNNIPAYGEFGGGVRGWPGTVVSNCVITGNLGGAYGGTLIHCTLSGNVSYVRGAGAWNSVLNYCTLEGNTAEIGGGGAYKSVLNHCTLYGNSATESEGLGTGGGVLECALSYCLLINNSAQIDGGGASQSKLTNCTLIGNSANYGGAVSSSTLDNCRLLGNSATNGGGGAYDSRLTNCTISGNTADHEGGVSYSILDSCTVSGNTAQGDGGGAGNNSILNHCLVANNSADSGGGAVESKLTNCVITGNSAVRGGGVSDGILVNCKLISNHAEQEGGGALGGWFYNCTLASNSSGTGGGARFSRLTNSIVFHNTATNGANHLNSSFHFSCTTPLPVDGTGNLTNEPAFLDLAGGNLRLASNSPCLNAGDNAFASDATDLDGRARITGGTVDMGAYEFQSGVSGVFLGWLQQFSLRTDGTDDTLDTDDDHANNFQEWRAGTIPTNALSTLRLLSPTAAGPDLVVRWASVPGKSYFLTRSTNLTTGAGFVPFAQNLPGQPGSTTHTDTNAASSGERNYFYRVGVEP